jgi:RimJ/RimL family protein N-acetyltransferase
VDLFIEPENLASLAVARSCGYQELELLSRDVEIGGRRRDMIRHAAYRP